MLEFTYYQKIKIGTYKNHRLKTYLTYMLQAKAKETEANAERES